MNRSLGVSNVSTIRLILQEKAKLISLTNSGEKDTFGITDFGFKTLFA